MSEAPKSKARDHHDWHSLGYVDQWIGMDVARGAERRPMLDEMMTLAGFERGAQIQVLDLAAGYGAVTEALTRAYPDVEVTLQDISQQMLDRAREHLSSRFSKVKFVRCDLTDPHWTSEVGGPFDLIVSSIGIHNIDNFEKISACYRDVFSITSQRGRFLNCDYFNHVGGTEIHIRALRDAGFNPVDCPWRDEKHAILRACRQ
jgi:ubiquinone/menaquinone biosynthesis C-methylase UbiE